MLPLVEYAMHFRSIVTLTFVPKLLDVINVKKQELNR